MRDITFFHSWDLELLEYPISNKANFEKFKQFKVCSKLILEIEYFEQSRNNIKFDIDIPTYYCNIISIL